MGSVRLLETSILSPLGATRETSGWRLLVPLAGTVSATEWGADCIPIVRSSGTSEGMKASAFHKYRKISP